MIGSSFVKSNVKKFICQDCKNIFYSEFKKKCENCNSSNVVEDKGFLKVVKF